MRKAYKIRQYFVRQSNHHDCGIACLRMMLNYCGRTPFSSSIRKFVVSGDEGMSLLELRNLATELGFKCKNVTMEIAYLRNSRPPCILHLVNNDGVGHYQVYFGSRKRAGAYQYLLADPARFVYQLAEEDLEKQWLSKAALFFEDISERKTSLTPGWINLFKEEFFPAMIWLIVPVLALGISLFTLAVSFLLQKGINDPLSDRRTDLLVSIVGLLLVILFFKGVLTYVKQRVQVALSFRVNENLYRRFLSGQYQEAQIGKAITEIQKIQAAINAVIGIVFSDGLLMVLLLAITFYYLPVAGGINSCFILLLIGSTIRLWPELSFKYAHLSELSLGFENKLKVVDSAVVSNLGKIHQECLNFSKTIANKIARVNFYCDCLTAFNITLVFILGIVGVKQQEINYTSFVLIVLSTFLISTLGTRLSNACHVVNDGVQALQQFNYSFKT